MGEELVGELRLPGGRVFQAVLADLLREPVDAIVNAANGHLAHGGGVAGAISRAAGPELDRESQAIVRERGTIPVGEAAVTTAGRLPFKGVIHAVGPQLGQGDEEAKLVRACVASFQRADERGWTSLALPAISSGIFAVPVDVCARAYVRAVKEFWTAHPDSPLRTIRLALFDGPIVDAVRAALRA